MEQTAVASAVFVGAVAPPVTSLPSALLVVHFWVAAINAAHRMHYKSLVLAPIFAVASRTRAKQFIPAAFVAADLAYLIWQSASTGYPHPGSAIALLISFFAFAIEFKTPATKKDAP